MRHLEHTTRFGWCTGESERHAWFSSHDNFRQEEIEHGNEWGVSMVGNKSRPENKGFTRKVRQRSHLLYGVGPSYLEYPKVWLNALFPTTEAKGFGEAPPSPTHFLSDKGQRIAHNNP